MSKQTCASVNTQEINQDPLRNDNPVMTLLNYGLVVTSEKCICINLGWCTRPRSDMSLSIQQSPVSLSDVLNV